MAQQTTKAQSSTKAPKFQALDLWQKIDKTDPKFVKPITGKSYRGNSPNPTWLAMRLTEVLGPIGHGWGYEVIHERYVEGKPHALKVREGEWSVWPELTHELRIRFWTRDPASGEIGSFESYGATPYRYVGGRDQKWITDEDAAKKSLTDAITKAISMLGGAADIFLGRWDDNKYVAEMAEYYGSAEKPVTPGAPSGAGVQQNGGGNGAAAGDPGF